MDGKDKTKEVEDQQKKKIRVILTSTKVQKLEKVSAELIKRAKEQPDVSTKGPVRLPTKNLKLTVRKSPCGEGTKTWDHWEMQVHKRVIDFVCSLSQLKEITSIKIDSGVEVELNFNETE